VAAGEVRYFVPGGGPGGGHLRGLPEGTAGAGTAADAQGSDDRRDGWSGPGGRGGAGSEIAAWVQQNFARVTLGGQTAYDLQQPIG
jgi:hypothetical protein